MNQSSKDPILNPCAFWTTGLRWRIYILIFINGICETIPKCSVKITLPQYKRDIHLYRCNKDSQNKTYEVVPGRKADGRDVRRELTQPYGVPDRAV